MSAEAQLETIYAFCRALNARDVDKIATLLSDESFTHKFLPSTIWPETQGTHDKAKALAVFKGSFDNVVDFMNVCLHNSSRGFLHLP